MAVRTDGDYKTPDFPNTVNVYHNNLLKKGSN